MIRNKEQANRTVSRVFFSQPLADARAQAERVKRDVLKLSTINQMLLRHLQPECSDYRHI